MTKQQQANFLLVGLIGVVFLGCIVALQLTKPDADDATSDDLGEAPYNGEPAKNFTFVMPDSWKYAKNARKDIQSLTPNQELNFGVVESKNDLGMYYFATTAPDANNIGGFIQSIYSYNNQYQFERVYKLSTAPEKTFPGIELGTHPGAHIILHAIGHDGYKLIVLAQNADDSPGPCTEPLTLGRDASDKVREMLSLDLLDPYAKGLQPYRVPDDVYQAAVERENTCIDSL